MNNFKAFTTQLEREYMTPNASKLGFRDWLKKKEDVAKELTSFGGKRLLGITDKGLPIVASYHIDRETLQIDISLSHNLDTIRNSTLCSRRITAAEHASFPSLQHAMRPKSKKDYGEVTLNSINYLEKLIDFCESNTSLGKENGKCTSLLFQYVSHFIYEGSTEDDKARWIDITKAWDFPKGVYFSPYGR